jgi:hypothetical protein
VSHAAQENNVTAFTPTTLEQSAIEATEEFGQETLIGGERARTEGSGVGFTTEPPVFHDANILKIQPERLPGGVDFPPRELALQFSCEVSDGLDINWNAQLMSDGRLLLHVPDGALPDGSKECFVRILEFAEEKLGCKQVLVDFRKDRQDLKLLTRTFMYFGFCIMPPDASKPLVGPENLAMVYKID